jgi:UDP-2,3-diacylglucosamine pyrophosphatase LpxH
MDVQKTARGHNGQSSPDATEDIFNLPIFGELGSMEAPAPNPNEAAPAAKFRFRSIWLSDIHLGTRGCKIDFLLDFLRNTESEYLYLVGDIIDAWQLKKSWYWPQSHNEAMRLFLRKAGRGTKVFYVPGNHDEFFRNYTDMRFGGVSLMNDMIHTTADGRRFLVIHGDAFDGVVSHAKWLAVLGDWSYHAALAANSALNKWRRRFGYPYWSLSAYLKQKVKNAVSFISNYEHALTEAARDRDVDGVVCGHIHKAELRDIDGITYANDGDWVESCTALVEDDGGKLEILRWTEMRHFSFHDTLQ